MMTGYQKREEREWERTAWLAAHVINISQKMVKKNITMDDLLGRRSSRGKKQPGELSKLYQEFGIEEVGNDGDSR